MTDRSDSLFTCLVAMAFAICACTVPNDKVVIGAGTDVDASVRGQGGTGPVAIPGKTGGTAVDGGAPSDSMILPGTGGNAPPTGSEGDTDPATAGTGGSPPSNGGMAGVPAPPSSTGGTGGSPAAPSTGGTGGSALPGRALAYDFEADAQGWQDLKSQGSLVTRSTAKAASGNASLAIVIDTQGNPANGNERYIGVPRNLTPVLKAGQPVRYQVWIPSGSKLVGVQPFVVTQGTGRGGVGRWQGTFKNVDSLAKDAWNVITVDLPSDYEVSDLEWVGVQFITQNGGWTGTVYIDAVVF